LAGKSVSGDIDEAVAARLATLARSESRTPASVVSQAVDFYAALPESARTALRRLGDHATGDERRWFENELVRLLLRADFSLTQRMMAEEIGPQFAEGADEAGLEAAAREWAAASTS
jgi:predicted transcriptional regulator